MDNQIILDKLGEIRDHRDYDQNGTFEIVKALAESTHFGLIWHALCIAHCNGLSAAADSFGSKAQDFQRNSELIRSLHDILITPPKTPQG